MLTNAQLLQLHNAIALLAPISGVRESNFGYEVDYLPSATTEQQEAIATLLDTWTPTAPPEWGDFIEELTIEILGAIAASPTASLITTRMAMLATSPSIWKGGSDTLISAWNAAPPSLNADQRGSLNSLAIAKSIPLSINGSNLLTVT